MIYGLRNLCQNSHTKLLCSKIVWCGFKNSWNFDAAAPKDNNQLASLPLNSFVKQLIDIQRELMLTWLVSYDICHEILWMPLWPNPLKMGINLNVLEPSDGRCSCAKLNSERWIGFWEWFYFIWTANIWFYYIWTANIWMYYIQTANI